MAGEVLSGGNIEPRALEDEMRTAFLDYAMSVIVSRANSVPLLCRILDGPGVFDGGVVPVLGHAEGRH